MLARLEAILTSTRARWVGWGSVLGLIAMGALYADYSANRQQGFQWCLENAEACEGREILLPVWDVVEVGEGVYQVFKATGPIPIQGVSEGLEVGDTVSIRGRFDKASGRILEVSREVHHRRPLKKALSGLGLILFALGLPWCLRLKGGRLWLRG